VETLKSCFPSGPILVGPKGHHMASR